MTGDATYDPDLFALLETIGEGNAWGDVRNRIIGDAVASAAPGLSSFVEVGCGVGSVLAALEGRFPGASLVGIDLHHRALVAARPRTGAVLAVADVHRPPLRLEFDAAGLFDVIEHLDDPVPALAATAALVKRGGHVLITVPGHPRLWSQFDEVAHHRRRYTLRALSAQITEAGLEPVRSSHFMAALAPVAWVRRKLTPDSHKRDLNPSPIASAAIRALVGWEPGWQRRGRSLPFGTSILAVTRRP